jgi:hypothetical protein
VRNEFELDNVGFKVECVHEKEWRSGVQDYGVG